DDMAPTHAFVPGRRSVFRSSSLRPQHVRLHSRVSMVRRYPRLDHLRGAFAVCNDCGRHLSRSGKNDCATIKQPAVTTYANVPVTKTTPQRVTGDEQP